MDLLENIDALPEMVRNIVEKYGQITNEITHDEAEQFQSELEAFGYEIDFDMSMSEAYDLREIEIIPLGINKAKGVHNGLIYHWSSDLKSWVKY